MASYVNVFGGTPVQTSMVPYITIALNGDLALQWPISYLDIANVVGRAMKVVPNAGGHTITLPSATKVSVGQDFMIYNPSAYQFFLETNLGAHTYNIQPGQAYYFLLDDNSTADGVFITFPFTAGGPTVTSVDAISATQPALTVVGGPITSAGTFTFTLGPELVGLNALAGTGYAIRTGVGVWQNGSIVQGANIIVTHGDGVAANTNIALSNTLVGLNSVGVGNLELVGNTIQSTNPSGDIRLTPNANGNIVALTNNGNVNLTSAGTGKTIIGTMSFDGVANSLTATNGPETLAFRAISTTIGKVGGTPVTIGPGVNGPAFVPATGGQEAYLGLLSYPLTDNAVLGLVPVSNGSNQLKLGLVPGENMLINGNFQVWQLGTSFNAIAGTTYTADRWQVETTGGVTGTMNQVIISPNNFGAAVGRLAGDASVGTVTLAQTLTLSTCIGAASIGSISLRFNANAGAGFSGAGSNLRVRVIGGTGNNDVSALSTGFTGQITLADQTKTLVVDNYSTFVINAVAIPANITQLAVYFSYTTAGVAAAFDVFRVADIHENLGPQVTALQHPSFNQVLEKCQYFTQKSFVYGTAPATNAGVNTGEAAFISNVVAAGTAQATTIRHPRMRIAPTVTTIYNPAAANNNARNLDRAVDCTAVAVVGNTDSGFSITTTAGAATVIGDRIGFHYFRTAELF